MGKEWNGSVVIVTGAASGIGRASVHAFAAAGAKVIASDIAEGVEALADETPGGMCVALRGDAGDEAHVIALVAEAERHGTLRGFFANAGIDTVTTPMLLKVVGSKKIDPALLITHRFTFDQMLEAYETFGNAQKTGAMKVIIAA